MADCVYVPQITAEFGKTVTDDEINREFQEIERVFDCFAKSIGSNTETEENITDNGIVDNSYTIDPAFGTIQYLEIQGDTELDIETPELDDPKLITLVIANAGSVETGTYGKFNFKSGTVWTHDRDGAMDGKPWNMYANLDGSTNGTQYTGFYGGIVQCIHDGAGWIYLVFARHHLDIFSAPNPDDIYDWR
jgi:hypothetical protein